MPGFWDQVPGGFRGGQGLTQEVNSATPDPYWSNYFRDRAQNTPQFQNPYRTGNMEQARLEQQRVIQELQRLANGDMSQLNASYDQARGNVAALGGMRRNSGAGATMRNIATQQAGMSAQQAGDAAVLQRQQELAAQQAMQQLYGQMSAQDAAQARGMSDAELAATGLNDAMAQFYLGAGIGTDISNQQLQGDLGRASLGFDLESRDINDRLYQQLMQMGGSAAATASSIYGSQSPSSSGYRQVDGQNSIVPEWDK